LRGKAFVEYETHENAVKAMNKTNDTSLDGRTINVEFSG
jgi:RNA recognition motif-containing protein